jgi:hypothetical protein
MLIIIKERFLKKKLNNSIHIQIKNCVTTTSIRRFEVPTASLLFDRSDTIIFRKKYLLQSLAFK